MPRSRRDDRFLIVTLSFDPHGTAGQGSRTNGSFAKGARRLSEKSPAGYPPAHHRDSTPRERGRLARMLSLGLPLNFPAMRHPATLPAGTAWARPKQSHGVVAVRSGSRRWVRLYQDLCGRDARAPGGLPPMTGSHQRDKSAEAFWRQLSLKEVHQSSCLI